MEKEIILAELNNLSRHFRVLRKYTARQTRKLLKKQREYEEVKSSLRETERAEKRFMRGANVAYKEAEKKVNKLVKKLNSWGSV